MKRRWHKGLRRERVAIRCPLRCVVGRGEAAGDLGVGGWVMGVGLNGAVSRGEWDGQVTLAEARRIKRGVRAEAARPGAKARKPRKARGKGLRGCQRLALGVGGVGAGLLALSVTHCTEAIGLLTGSHWALAGLLAVGIDAGMVVSELAELAGYKAGGKWWPTGVAGWARGYVVAAVVLSVLLNAYSFGLHAEAGMTWAAWLLGAVIPGLIYCLGRVAGGLWLSE